jgi:hypothetical protein
MMHARLPFFGMAGLSGASENDLTLLEENGEYFVNFADRIGTYRDFVEMLFDDAEIYPDLVAGDVCANFFNLMKSVSERWNEHITGEVILGKRS